MSLCRLDALYALLHMLLLFVVAFPSPAAGIFWKAAVKRRFAPRTTVWPKAAHFCPAKSAGQTFSGLFWRQQPEAVQLWHLNHLDDEVEKVFFVVVVVCQFFKLLVREDHQFGCSSVCWIWLTDALACYPWSQNDDSNGGKQKLKDIFLRKFWKKSNISNWLK